MPTWREQAETLRLGLLMGLVEPDEAISWADRLISDAEKPPVEVIDVALASRQPKDEIVRLLRQVPGPADFVAAAHRALGLLHQRSSDGDLPLEVIADRLWVYSVEASIPEAERQEAANFIDEYQCLEHFGTPESLSDDVYRFLVQHASTR